MAKSEFDELVVTMHDLMDTVDEVYGHSVKVQVALGALWMSLLEGRRRTDKAAQADTMEARARKLMEQAMEGWPDLPDDTPPPVKEDIE